jgi:hypothetical protein
MTTRTDGRDVTPRLRRTTGLVASLGAGAVLLTACGGPVPLIGDPEAAAVAPECHEVDQLEAVPAGGVEPTGTGEPPPDTPVSSDDPEPPEGERDDPGLDARERPDATPEGRQQTELAPEIERWGLEEASDSYAGLWIDQDLGGFVVAFAADVDDHAAEVRERFDEGLAIAEAETSYAELSDIQDRLGQETGVGHAEAGVLRHFGVDVMRNRVSVGIFDPDDERLAELSETYGADRLCFEIEDPPEPIDEGVTPLAKADGWRDDVPGEGGFAIVEVAYDLETAERAWAENVPDELEERDDDLPAEPGVYGDLDDVDFDSQVVVVWSSGQSGSCPGWLADIRMENGTVHLERGATDQMCTDDFNPYRMLLAVDRDRLPAEEDLPHGDIDGVPDGEVTRYPDADG